MKNNETVILKKDMMFVPMIQQLSIRGTNIHLASPDFVAGKDCVALLDWNENGLQLQVTCDNNDFHDYEIGPDNPRKEPHKQGNTIAFYFQPNGKTNFYQFEFASRKIQAVHYCFKAKDGKYKRNKIRNVIWQTNQEHIEDIWSVSFDIPWETVACSDKNIVGSRFLIIRYNYKPSSPDPVITNSMRLPANQLLNPAEWNIIMPDNTQTPPTPGPVDHLTQMLNEMRNKYRSEMLERSDSQEKLAEFYCELLNRLYAACDCPEYDETFRRLERFNNLPEFWDSSEKMKRLIHDLWGILETKCFGFVEVIHLVMEGATHLANKELQEQKIKQNQREHERLEKSKTPQKTKIFPFDNKLITCFTEIFKKEKEGTHFGRLGPQRYFYDHCCKHSSGFKFPTFRKKYSAWLNAKCPAKDPDSPAWTCPYGKKCVNFKPDPQ